MQSNRITKSQKRAKRRTLALAICATAFVGYNTFSLFAEDTRPIQLRISQMGNAPAVKAVGIRMLDSDEKTSSAPQELFAVDTKIGTLPPLPSPQLLPPPTTLQTESQSTTLPPPLPTLPMPSGKLEQSQLVPGFSNLTPPPRMSDVFTNNSNGKVVVKLSGNEGIQIPSNQKPSQLASTQPIKRIETSSSVDMRVYEQLERIPKAKMPAFAFAKPVVKKETTLGNAVSSPPQTSIRMSLADNGRDEHATSNNPEHLPSAPSKSRTPQLMKHKPTQITHTVVLAQSTDIDSQTSMDPNSSDRASSNLSDAFPVPVDVTTSAARHPISNGLVGPNSRPGNDNPSVVVDAVQDAFVSLVPPTKDTKNGSRLSNNQSALPTPEPADSARRNFDSRFSNLSPVATVELECLAATTMDIASKINAVAIQDQNICKILKNERTVSLVGNQLGTTLIQIWTADLGETPQMIRVNVSQPGGRVQATHSEVKDIKQVIAQGFPNASVNILSKDDGGIEVRGTTDSEDSARRILELVRKLYLVPVKDKLTVTK